MLLLCTTIKDMKKGLATFIAGTILFVPFAWSQNVGVGASTPIGKLHVKGGANISQLIIDAHSTQSNTSPLIKLRNSLGNDLLWIHADDSSNVFIGLHAGRFNNASALGFYNTFIGSDAGYSNTSGDYNTANGNHALFSNTTGANNTAIGSVALFSNTTGANNTANGSYSLSTNTTGGNNSANGYGSLFSNTTGTNNTGIGFESLFSNTTGFSNVAVGMRALFTNTIRSNLVAIGDSALYANGQGATMAFHATNNTGVGSKSLFANTTGSSNTALGYQSMKANTSGANNASIGSSSMLVNTTGSANVALGSNALRNNTIGSFNSAVGFSALNANTTGISNTAIGNNSLLFNTTGNFNAGLGHESLRSNTTGKNNTAIGYRTEYNNTSGINNTAIGDSALYTNTIGNNNTAIGHKANVSLANLSNATAIGSNSYAGASNSVVIGSINGVNGATVDAKVGIGTTAPHSSAALEVKSIDKGILVPRIALVATNSATPVSSPADALLVYNTATSGSGSNGVEPGFYYWKATENKWRSLNQPEGNSGYGTWGDCSMNNVSQYNPVAADDGMAIDYLGYSVSISGDYAIAGASEDDIGSNEGQGSAYMYHFNGGQWSQTQKLVASDGGSSDYFGYSVAISGNYAIVGAFDDKIGANEGQGSAYIFFYNGTQWIEQQKLTASDGGPYDAFGISVSIDGEYAAIGAIRHDVGTNGDQGCVYVFKYNGSAWLQQQKLLASDPAANQKLGVSVSINSNRIISGTDGATVGGNAYQGSAYVYSYNGSVWSQQQKLTAADGGPEDWFGYSVSIQGDDVIVGAFGDDIGSNTNQGSAYIFHFESNTWVQKQKVIANDGDASDEFGISVALYNDHVLIGASSDAVGSSLFQGSAYIYQNIGGLWMLYQKVINPAGGSEHHFGYATSLYGDRFIVGSYGAENDRGIVVFGKINQ